ncbi:MAG: FAD-dependent monooxygenase [Pseudomonadota bacterium]
MGGKHIDIAGAGVAGLATAVALAQDGANVVVHERAPEITEVGAGLQISANGIRALRAIGLDGALMGVALRSRGVRLIDGLNDRLVLELVPKSPSYFVHRARLIEVLADGAIGSGVEIRTGTSLSPGTSEADFVIGADGIRSNFRAAIDGESEARFTGQVAWRAVIEDGTASAKAEVYMGPGRHLVTYPLAGGLRNIVAFEERADWAEESWYLEDRPMAVRAAFARFPERVQTWLGEVTKLYLWGLFRHPVAETWEDGRQVLVGDAAHPTLPYLAQGANLALEDAVVLARALAGPGLSAYGPARRGRAKAVVDAATSNAWRFHIASPILRQTAFAALKVREALRPGAGARSFDWVWGYDPTSAKL